MCKVNSEYDSTIRNHAGRQERKFYHERSISDACNHALSQRRRLDFESQEKLFNNLIENGVDGILVEGSSSEFFAMPMDQRREMAKFAIETIDHRVKLIIGTSSMVADEIVASPTTAWTRGRTPL